MVLDTEPARNQLPSKCSLSSPRLARNSRPAALSPHQPRVPATLPEGDQANGGIHRYVGIQRWYLVTLIYRVPAAEKPRERTLLGGAKGNTEKFGPLKVVLGKALLARIAWFAYDGLLLTEQPFDTIFRKLLPSRTGLQTSCHI